MCSASFLSIRKAGRDIMDPKTISISARACTEAETKALSLWSASFLPLCRIWAARRGLRPPTDVVEALQKLRFEATAIPETMLEPLITVPSNNEQSAPNVGHEGKLEGVATDLSNDLRRFQVSVSRSGLHNREQFFLTASRDLRRFQAAMSRLQLIRAEIVAGEPIIVTLFSRQRGTLYIPLWLIDAIPRTMFEPNQSFYRARPASLAWLLLDAIVITTSNEFKTVYEYYEA
jgi:hypothetical protein